MWKSAYVGVYQLLNLLQNLFKALCEVLVLLISNTAMNLRDSDADVVRLQ